MRNESDKGKKIIWILSVVIAVLVLILAYFLVVQPQIQNKQDDLRLEGLNYAINSILASVQTQGYVEIPVGNESLILIPYMPEQTTEQIQTESQ